ncbi:LOW QUALITY PROTEIN: actinia tenebrosa protease inhibitors-like [Galleria mellonella]|uniref:LOW QUALITY PROTEIN: actinia tenebrosa protease inhibitors-like n=1 Tax=Galleria mellonella TaxID=7137 RepID=A0ABM3N728_GALME|nr:LOW QUALITY PROTEIN: actinia tenebrosa protease inhibitors-like [Galleria mellonella]
MPLDQQTSASQSNDALCQYYYNAQLDQCQLFTYSGCGKNKNNFNMLLDCERHCKEASYMGLQDINSSTFCTLQPNSGVCMALFTNFLYVVCGMGGNQNRFRTMEECHRHCCKTHML